MMRPVRHALVVDPAVDASVARVRRVIGKDHATDVAPGMLAQFVKSIVQVLSRAFWGLGTFQDPKFVFTKVKSRVGHGPIAVCGE